MEAHYQLTNEQFSQQFSDCTLPPQWFSHTAHLRLTYILLQQYPLEEARQLMCSQIQTFDQTFGDGTKYHRTLTEASIQVVWHFMSKSITTTFPELLAEFPRLVDNFKGLLLTHYRPETLFPPPANTVYQQPDLLVFPA